MSEERLHHRGDDMRVRVRHIRDPQMFRAVTTAVRLAEAGTDLEEACRRTAAEYGVDGPTVFDYARERFEARAFEREGRAEDLDTSEVPF